MSNEQYDPKIISPSVVTAWLACPHSLTLRLSGKGKPNSARHFGNFAELIMQRGLQHEADCLESLRKQFSSEEILKLIKTSEKETFQEFNDRVTVPEPHEYKVVYQAPLIFDGMRGIADFLVSVDSDGKPLPTFMPVDAKLARNAAKPGHVLQLCFYADAIENRTGTRPEKVEIWLGKSGRDEPEVIYLRDIDAYWNRSKKKLKAILESETLPVTDAVPCSHCTFCSYQETCETEWKQNDSLFYVAGATKQDREKLVDDGVHTRADLAIRTSPVKKLSSKRLAKLQRQAAAQVQSRASLTDDFVPSPSTHVEIFAKPAEILEPYGFELLPPADSGDIFLDYEGHPFWTIQEGLIFLFGYWSSDDKGRTWKFTDMWAHDKQSEQIAGEQLVKLITARQQQYPNMHVYHYNHTERSSLASLLVEQTDTLNRFQELVDKNIFIDLYQIIRQGLIIGVESYGLKNIEKIAGFNRQLPESAATKGADAVVEYENYMIATRESRHGDAQQHLLNIALYNQGDVEATQAVRDWLLQLRAIHYPKMPWPLPAAILQPKVIDPVVAQLLSFPPGTPENLLGHVCGFWDRENNAAFAALNVLLDTNPDDHLTHLRILGELEFVRFVDEPPKKNKEGSDEEDSEEAKISMVLSFPTQDADGDFEEGKGGVAFRNALGELCYASLTVHRVNNEVKISWKYARDSSLAPKFLVKNEKYNEDKKRAALAAIAAQAVSSTGLSALPTTQALLSHTKIDVTQKCSGKYQGFPTDIKSLTDIVQEMNREVLPIQGPPGTGKTFTGAGLIVNLFRSIPNVRIGFATTSHSACNNLAEAIKTWPLNKAELAKVLRSPTSDRTGIAGITIANPDLKKIPRPFWSKDYQIFAGVVSPFCAPEFTQPEFQLDYLFIDEAGQMSLADAVAISRSAKNIILLGDPLQLPQVVQASHPEGSGRSVLEHFLGDHEIVQPTEGVFLDTSYRMHPEVCDYISQRIYQGKLKAFKDCQKQNVDGEAGLRVCLMNHADRSSISIEEVNKIAEFVDHYLGKPWTDRTDEVQGQRTIGQEDILIVAPYNMQRRAIESKLKAIGAEKVQVGTVDKFQGREAAIVIFSMAASSADDVPRGARFLFDRNRLNVAVSRAKCLAIIVCNEPLLDTVAKDIDQMKSISALCAFEASATQL